MYIPVGRFHEPPNYNVMIEELRRGRVRDIYITRVTKSLLDALNLTAVIAEYVNKRTMIGELFVDIPSRSTQPFTFQAPFPRFATLARNLDELRDLRVQYAELIPTFYLVGMNRKGMTGGQIIIVQLVTLNKEIERTFSLRSDRQPVVYNEIKTPEEKLLAAIWGIETEAASYFGYEHNGVIGFRIIATHDKGQRSITRQTDSLIRRISQEPVPGLNLKFMEEIEPRKAAQPLRGAEQIPEREQLESLSRSELEQLVTEHGGTLSLLTGKQHEFMKEALNLVFQKYKENRSGT